MAARENTDYPKSLDKVMAEEDKQSISVSLLASTSSDSNGRSVFLFARIRKAFLFLIRRYLAIGYNLFPTDSAPTVFITRAHAHMVICSLTQINANGKG